ncbi:MAG: AMP-binding protein [Aquirufa sp.]
MQVFSPLSDQLFVPSSDFEREVLAFCELWKSGQPSFLFHTSGSTGTPKPIWVSRDAMEASALSTGKWLQLKPNDVVLASLPVHYIAGAMLLVRAIVLDLKVCLVNPSVNPLERLAPISIQLASFVPNQWHAILESGIDLSVFFADSKGILLGGAALSSALKTRSLEFPFPIYETYGMTETVSHIAYRSIKDPYFQTLGSVEIGVDERACLKIKCLMTDNVWVQTNDIVSIEDDSSFEIKGRFDRVINSAGRKIHPEELEKIISSSDNQPASFFIEGIPDAIYGQQVTLFYTGDWVMSSQLAVQGLLRSHFESWQLPKQYIPLEKFQFTSSGKIDRLNSVALYLNSK